MSQNQSPPDPNLIFGERIKQLLEKEWKHRQEGIELYREREQLAHEVRIGIADSTPMCFISSDLVDLILQEY